MRATQRGAMENQTIYGLASECESLFNQHVTKLQDQQGELDNTCITLARFIQNSHERFSAWASYMGVFAQPYLSLDQRLAISEAIRQMVLEMLEILYDNLSLLNTLIDQLIATSETLEQEASEPQYYPNQKELETNIQEAKESIDGSVSRLHRLGATIRQSSTAGLASRVKAFAAKGSKTSLEKITSLIVSFLYPRASASLKKLLGQSILDRYFRLKYKPKHQQSLPQWRVARFLDHKDLLSTTEDIELREDEREIAPTRNPDDIDQRPTPSKSQGELSKPSMLQDELVLVAIKNKPAISIATSDSTVPIGDIQYPKPPKPDHPYLSFTACDWCAIDFENAKFQDVRWWRKHVDQDLRPYICLTKECTNQDTTFSNYKDWRSHMNDVHSTSWIKNICAEIQWKCDFDNAIFQDEVSLIAHMTNSHQDLLTEEQISEVAFWSAVPIQSDVDRCPLCQYEPPPAHLGQNQPNDFVGSTGEPKPTGLRTKKNSRVKFEDNLLAELDYSNDESTRSTPFNTDRNFTQPWSDEKSLERHISTHLKALSFMSLRLDAFQANYGVSDDSGTSSQKFQDDISESGHHSGWDSDIDAISLTVEDYDNANDLSNNAALNASAPDLLPSIRFSSYYDPRSTRPSFIFPPITRTLPTGKEVIRVGRYSERDSETMANVPDNQPSAAAVGFKSKVVSRRHCEFWYENGKWYIRDIKSSSGTFLNNIRLSPPSQESKAFPVKDGDIVQLGIHFKGGEELIFRCVKMRLELNRGFGHSQNLQGDTKKSGVLTMFGRNLKKMSLPLKDFNNANDLYTNSQKVQDDTKESGDPTKAGIAGPVLKSKLEDRRLARIPYK